ncbi:MAG: L-threonylcarbamoyladenylate synthase [Bacteroidia bacterium]
MIGVDVDLASTFLKEGKVVGIPTETVYGLAANALNEDAVVSIYHIKNRPFFDPLILHFANLESAEPYVLEIPEVAYQLGEQFWPGPLTLLLNKNDKIPDLITSGSPKVAIRVPNHPLTLELLSKINFPLAAPSANPFGYISPTRPEHVEKQLGDSLPYILDGGECQVGIESTIIDCTEQSIRVLRLGGLSIQSIEACLGIKLDFKLNENSNPHAPGQLDKHYSPSTSFVLCDNIIEDYEKYKDQNPSLLVFGPFKNPKGITVLNLSEKSDVDEAAKNLFHYMRELDNMKGSLILAMKLPENGLGRAINDRLRRAAANS